MSTPTGEEPDARAALDEWIAEVTGKSLAIATVAHLVANGRHPRHVPGQEVLDNAYWEIIVPARVDEGKESKGWGYYETDFKPGGLIHKYFIEAWTELGGAE